ncbi:TetR/AcrR family transcriptional regulator [uncultured Tateyamaria sp.]|uniref:TetR/AcrR family transcriptional regulator n=1 Tax=uncultured Tateyamaria sp. TaxID=455651 RepID=UPI00261A5CC9|nr:TetR/AcrR family transcriptional regulator [uncultured Tateyamaria sp.]
MPRTTAHTNDELTERALLQFWHHGFHATSMDTLVKTTNVSRHGIYTAFGGKKQLFHACFDRYQDIVVTPAFACVEEPGADLSAIARYFETQIARGAESGLPGPGCFVANASTETAPHDAITQTKVAQHNARLRNGFQNALSNTGMAPPSDRTDALAQVCVVFTNGLWSMSRTTTDADALRAAVKTFLDTLKADLT